METGDFTFFKTYVLAIFLGALMGLERERKKEKLAGMRTFILVVLLGSICGAIWESGGGNWILVAGLFGVTILATTMLFLRVQQEIATGLTTAAALLIAYTIGILVSMNQNEAAIALSLATTVILYFKPELHDFSRSISERDLFAIFQFGLLAFIILPILPDRTYGPYDALNPYNIWLMVVMISGLNLVAYVILKVAGQRWSGPIIGVLGGLVSSTATTLSISRHAKGNVDFSGTGAVAIALASTVVLARMAFLIGIIHLPLLYELALPMSIMFLTGLIPVAFIWRRSVKTDAPVPETSNPVELKQALLFGLLYAVVLLAVSAGKDFFGAGGVNAVALISGLTDVDAITLSNSRLAGNEVLSISQAGVSIMIAYVANLVFKLALVGALGTMRMFRLTLLCFVCLAVPSALVLL